VPTAFTGYSFHVAEALLVFANEVIVTFLLPIHRGLHRGYHLFTTIIHEGGWGRGREEGRLCSVAWHGWWRHPSPAGLAAPSAATSSQTRFSVLASWPGWQARPWYGLPMPPACVLPCQTAPAGGHAGYEIAPFIPTLEQLVSLALTGTRPNNVLNTVRHHDMHHRYPRSHFSLYMTHWDRLCGTEHPSYRDEVAAHFAAPEKAGRAPAAAGAPPAAPAS
jgi:hypothetical protein